MLQNLQYTRIVYKINYNINLNIIYKINISILHNFICIRVKIQLKMLTSTRFNYKTNNIYKKFINSKIIVV